MRIDAVVVETSVGCDAGHGCYAQITVKRAVSELKHCQNRWRDALDSNSDQLKKAGWVEKDGLWYCPIEGVV